jgi:hypothetical protein
LKLSQTLGPSQTVNKRIFSNINISINSQTKLKRNLGYKGAVNDNAHHSLCYGGRNQPQHLLETQEGVHKHGTLFYASAAQTHLLLQKHTPATKASKV